MKLRKGPVCRGTLTDGSACGAKVERVGDCCAACLEQLAAGADAAARRALAGDADLPLGMFEVLAADPDAHVRLTLARREDCPLVILQELEHDTDAEVQAAAGAAMSIAFSPRVTQGGLFTLAEVEALRPGETTDAPADPFGAATGRGAAPDPCPPLDRIRRIDPPAAAVAAHLPVPATASPAVASAVASPASPGSAASAFDEILGRLDALGDRLTMLESRLATTGDRLGALTGLLDQLGLHDPPARRPVHRIREPRSADIVDLTPCGPPHELDTGLLPRPEVVAAAWLSVIPVLALHRDAGPPTLMSPSVAGPLTPARAAPVAGPLTPARAAPVAELVATDPRVEASDLLMPADLPVDPVADAVSPRRASREGRRRQLHAKRRRAGR